MPSRGPVDARKYGVRALAGMAVATVVLVLVETVFRSMWGPAPAAIPVYDAIAERSAYLSIAEGEVDPVFGKGELPSFPVDADATRLAVLGGSSVHGGSPRVSLEEEFPARLGRLLDVDVLNLGSPGLDSHDLVRLLVELEPVDLDLLVVYSGHNDFGNTFFEERYGDVGSALFAHLHGVLSRLQLYSRLSLWMRPLTGSKRRSSGAEKAPHPNVPSMTDERRALALSGLAANLERIAWLTGQRGLELVLVVPVSRLPALPAPSECAPGQCPRDHLQRARRIVSDDPAAAVALLQDVRDHDPLSIRAPTAAQQVVRQLAATHAHVSLVDPFVGLPSDHIFPVPDRRLFIDPVHLSHSGHREMSELIARELKASGRL